MSARLSTPLPDHRNPSPRACLLADLSPRELEILRLIAEGCRDREMAERLCLSPHTVANHVRNILGKLDVPSRAAAIGLAMRGGLM